MKSSSPSCTSPHFCVSPRRPLPASPQPQPHAAVAEPLADDLRMHVAHGRFDQRGGKRLAAKRSSYFDSNQRNRRADIFIVEPSEFPYSWEGE